MAVPLKDNLHLKGIAFELQLTLEKASCLSKGNLPLKDNAFERRFTFELQFTFQRFQLPLKGSDESFNCIGF